MLKMRSYANHSNANPTCADKANSNHYVKVADKTTSYKAVNVLMNNKSVEKIVRCR